jgi:hypothetical protein
LPVHRARVLDLQLELESGLPEIAIVKEQARLEFDLVESQRGIGEGPVRLDVEIGLYASVRAVFAIRGSHVRQERRSACA